MYIYLTIYTVFLHASRFFPDLFPTVSTLVSAGVKIPASGSLSSDAFDTAWNLAGWMEGEKRQVGGRPKGVGD